MISIVIPTYNRPDTLRVAIASVIAQSWHDWELLVVGDACGPETAAVTEEFDDPRIDYVNLPARFGEQSGPNSVGMALAGGSHVAFLNHDDVWLGDHLERAMATLGNGNELYVGTSAFARRSVPDDVFGVAPRFTEINPAGRSARDAYVGHPVLFEPSSAWVATREAVHRVGPWRSASTLHRSPAQEWVMRAWLRGTRFSFGDRITVLKVVTHYQYDSSAGNYSLASREHQWLAAFLRDHDPDDVRRLIEKQLDAEAGPPHRRVGWRRRLSPAVMAPLGSVYRHTGADGYELLCRLRGMRKGRTLDDASRLRTGRPLPDPPDLEATIAEVRADR